MNAQVDDDTVPDQASGAVEDELDGVLLENVKMSYLPCVCLDSRPEQVFFVLVILSREKPAKNANFGGKSLFEVSGSSLSAR